MKSTLHTFIVCIITLYSYDCNATTESIRTFPTTLKEKTATCSDKAQIFAIETQMAIANKSFTSGKYTDAIEKYRIVIDLQPDHVSGHYNLGLAHLAVGDHINAMHALQKACTLDNNHARAHYFLGYTYQQQNLFENAIYYYERAVALDPNHFDAHLNKGRAQANLERIDDAIRSYHQALTLNAFHLNANFELGYLYNRHGNLEKSIYYYQRAVEIEPDRVDTNCNLAHALRYAGKMYDAIPFYKEVIKQSPHHAHAHCGLAECYLATGRFKKGFYHFEWRFDRMPDTRKMQQNRWNGIDDLTNKTILVRAEFGQGDTLQFARYLPLLKDRGARIILEVQHTLLPLFSHTPFVDQLVVVQDPPAQLPAFDYQIPIMSLPYVFGTDIDTIPASIPYLHTDEKIDHYWHEHYANDTHFKIAVCWEGSIYYEQFKSPYSKKSIPLTTFKPITQLKNVTVYSVQKMNGTDQLRNLPTEMNIHDFGEDFDMDHGRFIDTASVLKHMDLVITVDTAVAHLAGALGVPTWVLLPYVADWRWLTDRSDTPWYPTMQLFRQRSPHDWDTVIQEITQQLEKKLHGSNAKKHISPVAEVSIGELVDKMTILEIKSERITDTNKLHNIRNELTTLKEVFDTYVHKDERTKQLFGLMRELKSINEKLWDIEDNIRDKEAEKNFDNQFITLARSVYFTNDERGRVKRAINDLLGSRLVEEKMYKTY